MYESGVCSNHALVVLVYESLFIFMECVRTSVLARVLRSLEASYVQGFHRGSGG